MIILIALNVLILIGLAGLLYATLSPTFGNLVILRNPLKFKIVTGLHVEDLAPFTNNLNFFLEDMLTVGKESLISRIGRGSGSSVVTEAYPHLYVVNDSISNVSSDVTVDIVCLSLTTNFITQRRTGELSVLVTEPTSGYITPFNYQVEVIGNKLYVL